jgi:cellulose synthase/poly-beta-1,6-N-acetylglucosamine synthase-like glycosyltransferase/GGDEF domain-containing protein
MVANFELGADDYLAKPIDLHELLARVKLRIKRPPVSLDLLWQEPQTRIMSEANFRHAMRRELARAQRGGYSCGVARLRLYELSRVHEQFGTRVVAALALAIREILVRYFRPLDLIGRAADGSFLLFIPEVTPEVVERRLVVLALTIVRTSFLAGEQSLRVTPLAGFCEVTPGLDDTTAMARGQIALEHAAGHLDLRPIRYHRNMHPQEGTVGHALASPRAWKEAIRFPVQIASTFILGWVVPFGLYAAFGAAGFDITGFVYLFVVVSFIITAALIWTEGVLALRRIEPPEIPDKAYGQVSAIIAAYLPNEAPTLEATIEAFLRIDYPLRTQIILAYNTPVDMPIEKRLREIARADPRFIPMRIAGSTSKAQNVNAAISLVTSPVVGIYDADHQPDPDVFRRAWRWIASGSDVVQGHCVIRNGDASWVARTVAVEFETIYGVSHPGRARLHGFGLFGGSNGFWRTDVLRETRMRGSMLTEDIDAAIRAVESGYRITSDPYLVSRELAPTSLRALTHQRLRWAQGWYQVTRTRIFSSLKSEALTFRQKFGMCHLLVWREGFPWLSLQIVPIIAYWMWQAGTVRGVDWFVPLLVWITLLVSVTGPGQLYFTWRTADPQIRKNPSWFWWYLVISIVFYAGFKNLLARVANIKETLGETAWKVTSRS